MSNDFYCFCILFAVFAIPGFLCALLGCDSSFQPVCINLDRKEGSCIGYSITTNTCSKCVAYSRTCDSKGNCKSTCSSTVYFPCYSSVARFQLSDFHNKTCTYWVVLENPNLNYTISAAKTKYPVGKKKDFYVRTSDGVCVTTESAVATARAGISLCGIAFLILIWCGYSNRNVIFSKSIAPEAPPNPSPSTVKDVVDPPPDINNLEECEENGEHNDFEMVSSNVYPAIPAVAVQVPTNDFIPLANGVGYAPQYSIQKVGNEPMSFSQPSNPPNSGSNYLLPSNNNVYYSNNTYQTLPTFAVQNS